MSLQASTPAKYVYIPNLVGRQILRVQIISCGETTEGSNTMPTVETSILTSSNTFEISTISRASSPAPSLESVEQDE
ncbi:hypothetical protein BCR34DRAFT_556630 [Clohesyomyces aquaticus]|uniref:Uncharacterized protein n=1 Tax=Clohesyomyces aquaticus TaxID=1231657 RepID=A0A1Y2A2U0_9PLEO|nr:hypothetical protein BCR34DRAFT_556630 [Clohesyomyces aquaticus]